MLAYQPTINYSSNFQFRYVKGVKKYFLNLYFHFICVLLITGFWIRNSYQPVSEEIQIEELEAPVLLASTQEGFSATNDIPKDISKHETEEEIDHDQDIDHTTDQEDTTTYHTEVYQLEDLFSEE